MVDDVSFTASFGYLMRSDSGDDTTNVTIFDQTEAIDVSNENQETPFNRWLVTD